VRENTQLRKQVAALEKERDDLKREQAQREGGIQDLDKTLILDMLRQLSRPALQLERDRCAHTPLQHSNTVQSLPPQPSLHLPVPHIAPQNPGAADRARTAPSCRHSLYGQGPVSVASTPGMLADWR
jgi:hypothetical protein